MLLLQTTKRTLINEKIELCDYDGNISLDELRIT